MNALKKAWEAGYKNATWTRQDPDLAILHGDAEFERLYPIADASAASFRSRLCKYPRHDRGYRFCDEAGESPCSIFIRLSSLVFIVVGDLPICTDLFIELF